MALFSVRVEVDSFLQLQRSEREAIQSIAASLAAIVAKMNEPDPEPPPSRDLGALAEELRLKDEAAQAELDKAQGTASA